MSDTAARRHAQLALSLASVAERRQARRDEIADLLSACRQQDLSTFLAERRLLGLLGTRAIELAPDACDDAFRTTVTFAVRQARFGNMIYEHALARATQGLEEAGIPALPLKGVALGERVYGDSGMRPTTDTDVLVAPENIARAIDVLEALGYKRPADPAWVDGRPLLHYTLLHPHVHVPALELHWRIHWSETRFSAALLAGSTNDGGPWRTPAPADDLASLLLFYARDGFAGLRLAADVAACWDRFGEQLPPGALDPYVAAHPTLRRSLEAGVGCAQLLMGVPGDRLLTRRAPDRSARLAMAAADTQLTAPPGRANAKIMAVDFLLSRGGDKVGFVRRYALHPLDELRRMYGLEASPQRVVLLRGAVHAAGALVKGGPRMGREILDAAWHEATRRRSSISPTSAAVSAP